MRHRPTTFFFTAIEDIYGVIKDMSFSEVKRLHRRNIPRLDLTINEFLYQAVKEGSLSMVEKLLAMGANPNIMFEGSPDTLLISAVKRDNLAIFCKLLTIENIDINAVNKEGDTAFTFTIKNRKKDYYTYLLDESKLDINKLDKNGDSPISLAIQSNQLELIGELLAKKALLSTDSQDKYATVLNNARLHYAVAHNDIASVQAILENTQVDINIFNARGVTPLYMAAEHGDLDLLMLLLRAGADHEKLKDPSVKVGTGRRYRHEKFVQLYISTVLKELEAKKLEEKLLNNERLHDAVACNDEKAVKSILTENVDVNAFNKDGITPLYMAGLHYNVDVITSLLQAGANPEKLKREDSTIQFSPERYMRYVKHDRIPEIIQNVVDLRSKDGDLSSLLKSWAKPENLKREYSNIQFSSECCVQLDPIPESIQNVVDFLSKTKGEEIVEMAAPSLKKMK